MTTIAEQFRIECSNGDVHTTDFLVEEPTVCADGYPVTNATVIDSITSESVMVKDDRGNTQGMYQTKAYHMAVTADPVTELKIKFNYPVMVYSVVLLPTTDNVGDFLSCIAAKDKNAGPIVAELTSGTSQFTSNSVAINRLKFGFMVSVGATEPEEELGEITGIDRTTNVVTVNGTAAVTYPPGTSMFISVPRVTMLPFVNDHQYTIGISTNGGNVVPVDIEMTTEYHNSSGTAKDFYFVLEYMY